MTTTELSFNKVSFQGLRDLGLDGYLQAHYEELNDKAFPLVPDWGRYYKLEELGMLHCYSAEAVLAPSEEQGAARSGTTKLVGYAIFLSNPNIHYSTSTWGYEDIYYLAPEYRKGMNGVKWLRYFLGDMESRVDKVIMGTKTKLEVGVILRRLGYKPFENLYSKVSNKALDKATGVEAGEATNEATNKGER